MKINLCAFLFGSACLFAACDSDKNSEAIDPAAPHRPTFAGDWENHGFIYSTGLILENNGKFRYYYRGCTGEVYSAGEWTSDGDFVTLTSFDMYKTDPPMEPIVTEREKRTSSEHKSESIKVDWTFRVTEWTSTIMAMPDSTHAYFDHQRFILRQDTLYGLDNNALFTGEKFGKRRIMMSTQL